MPQFKSRAEYNAWAQAQRQQQRPSGQQQPPVQQQPQQQPPQRRVVPPATPAQVSQPLAPAEQIGVAAHLHQVASLAIAMTAVVVAPRLPFFETAPRTAADWDRPAGMLSEGMRVRVHHPQVKVDDTLYMQLQVVHPVNAMVRTFYVPVLVTGPDKHGLPDGALLTGFHFPGTSLVKL